MSGYVGGSPQLYLVSGRRINLFLSHYLRSSFYDQLPLLLPWYALCYMARVDVLLRPPPAQLLFRWIDPHHTEKVGELNSATILSAVAFLHEVAVRVRNGTIVGKHVDYYQQDQFLGIPFAQPPIGDLRFNLPQSINQTWESPLNATEYGPMCIQYPLPIPLDPLDITYAQSEDCLTINVIRPSGTKTKDKLPVMVYIYGGGFQEGGSSDGRYNMSYMLQNSVQMGEPAIMVSMNYRLQGWGLIAGDDVRGQGVTNLSLRDQRLALEWIQENIEAFGGDRSRVALFGESVGAISIGSHLLAYGGRDDRLFSAAICQSGGTAFSSLLFLPVVDGTLIPEYNSVALAKGNFVKVPLIIGTNTDEGKLFAGYGVNTTAEFRILLQNALYIRTSNNETLDAIIELYPETGSTSLHGQSDDTINPAVPYGHQFTRAARWTGDAMFIAGRRYTCQLWTEHGVPCYSYRFNTIPNGQDPIARGATHFMEVAFAFDNVLGTGMDDSSFDVEPASRQTQYKQIGDLMSRMWMSFATTGSPNNHKLSFFNSTWPVYSLDAPRNIVFDGNITSFIENDDWRVDALKLIVDRALDFSR
ncbi:putative extracellular lipase [Cadophora sp. DSE1049]|nr:putative extracellular lipase [Cadophora sp. DSE1049]